VSQYVVSLPNSLDRSRYGAHDDAQIYFSGPVSGGNAFKGQTLTATAVLDKGAADLASVCAGGKSTEFDFPGLAGASTLAVMPTP